MECKCKNCNERFIGCHSNCDSYKQYKLHLAKEKEKYNFSVSSRNTNIEMYNKIREKLRRYKRI